MIDLLISQVPVPPEGVEQWLKILFWLSAGFTSVIVARSHLAGNQGRREIQSPLDIRKHPGTVTREEWEQTHGRISRERKEIDAAIKVLSDASEKRADALEDKIDANTEVTAATGATVEQMNLQLQQLNSHLLNRKNP